MSEREREKASDWSRLRSSRFPTLPNLADVFIFAICPLRRRPTIRFPCLPTLFGYRISARDRPASPIQTRMLRGYTATMEDHLHLPSDNSFLPFIPSPSRFHFGWIENIRAYFFTKYYCFVSIEWERGFPFRQALVSLGSAQFVSLSLG